LTKNNKKAEEDKEKNKTDDENPDLAERQKQIDEKYAREKVLEDRKLLQEQKKEFEDKRAQIIADREAKKWQFSANVKIEDPKKAANADLQMMLQNS
jgi:hypothetical protein